MVVSNNESTKVKPCGNIAHPLGEELEINFLSEVKALLKKWYTFQSCVYLGYWLVYVGMQTSATFSTGFSSHAIMSN